MFQGLTNRMESGYLLRDVVNLVDGIHFDSSDEIHTLSRLYETLLRDLRDAAGDSGEIYTPRPVVQFMVRVVDPQIGETVLDPACGTGGFLVETYRHLEKQADTVEKRAVLQQHSLYAGEEEAGIRNNFPEDRRSEETALLFLQLIMRRLRRAGQGRAGVVVPNGTLFGDGVAARIKAELLAHFNLHTVVRLPEGVFAPYTESRRLHRRGP